MRYAVIHRNRKSKAASVLAVYEQEEYAKDEKANQIVFGRDNGSDSVSIKELSDNTSYVVWKSDPQTGYKKIIGFCETEEDAKSILPSSNKYNTFYKELDIQDNLPENNSEYRLSVDFESLGLSKEDDWNEESEWEPSINEFFDVIDGLCEIANWGGEYAFCIEGRREGLSGPKVEVYIQYGYRISRPIHPADLDWKES